MGVICSEDRHQQPLEFDLINSTFIRTQPIQIPYKYLDFLDNIKKVLTIYDSRTQKDLKWYKSIKYDFYLYGEIKGGKPFGQCLIYSPFENIPQMPIIIGTKIDSHSAFSSQTLIIYSDLSYYYGQIFSKAYEFPKASGKGILVSKDFIYEGQFAGGLPNGYGLFKTRSLQFVGRFKNGLPDGEGVQRSKDGLFIGEIFANKIKKGTLITLENKKCQINQYHGGKHYNELSVQDQASILL